MIVHVRHVSDFEIFMTSWAKVKKVRLVYCGNRLIATLVWAYMFGFL